jgi:AcrR family transcriptional regulator
MSPERREPGPADAAALSEARRKGLLEAAFAVFMRYGFRKTSMDEVARAADISRQGLYLHFATKEELFRATARHALETSLGGAQEALRQTGTPLEGRLVAAFDSWTGRFVGMMGPGSSSDLGEAAGSLIGPLIVEHEARFGEAVARAISTGGLAAAYKPAGLTGRQLAETLNATARGLKHSSATRADFVRAMTIAVRALCLPLRERDREEAP